MYNNYEKKVMAELKGWQYKMSKEPSFMNNISKSMQTRMNNLIPAKVHGAITETIKQMIKAVLFGSEYTTRPPLCNSPLEERERLVIDKVSFYKKSAAASGAWTGSGGILLGLADFPILISIKLKFLFDTAALYGFDVQDYRERLFILYVFQLAFSSQKRRREIYYQVADWENYKGCLPETLDAFDWKSFQQEYRDYIDLAKMLQLVPGIGAFVGAYANYKLLDKLGETAMNAYRMRLQKF